MGLQEEIDRARAVIRSDGYSMSIGEWISLYESNEIDIHPEFQRFFRWSPSQKSRLIESILLGIPIPPVFVAQRSDGVWDVVDGLQRLSTIFQLAGILKDEDGNAVEPLILEKTKYLPSLEGKNWDGSSTIDKSLSPAQRLLIKRAKIDVSIILKESDDKAKYELFQRLNTGGTALSPQEVRNSIIVMLNRDLYQWFRKLANDESFRECTALTDRAVDEQYDMDLILRFVVLRKKPAADLASIGDMGDFLTDEATRIAESNDIDFEEEEVAFHTTFDVLRRQLGENSFKRFDSAKGKYMGGFLISAYEVMAMGVGYNFEQFSQNEIDIVDKARKVWKDKGFIANSGSGVRASSRLPVTISLGRRLLSL